MPYNWLQTVKAIDVLALSVLLCVCGGAFAAKAPPAQRPGRIVSLNLCTDQLLMMLVEPERIAAVTFLARDPASSVMVGIAQKLPITWGKAEEVLLLKPDLVLAGSYTSRATVSLLKKLKYRVVVIPPATGIADIVRNIRTIGKAVGEEKKAEKLVLRLGKQLARYGSDDKANAKAKRPLAALYFANGYSAGTNTLADSVVRKSGFATPGEKLPFSGTQKVSLEQLLLARPDAIVVGQRSYAGTALAYELFRHPVLRYLTRHRPAMALENALTVCGTPETIRAIRALAGFRRRHFGSGRTGGGNGE